MPDNVSQSQHITGLDFDISKALKDLQQIEEEVQASSQRIANIDFVVGDVINNKGSFSKEMEKAIILADKHKKKQEEIQAALDKNYKKNTENAKKLSDAEIAAEREKELITERVYETNERAYKLAQKGKNISDTNYVGEQKKVKRLQEQTDELVRQLKLSGELTEEQKEQLSIIQKQLREQENVYAKTTASVEKAPTSSTATGAKNFLRYNVANAAWQDAKSAASDVVDIETRVMEISRVMNLTTESAKDLRDNLIDYGVEYGRSFDEVSEIALKFTQAGYEANDVLSMTKAMLLGINTAELNAESGTTSLIGIMQQWGYEAEDLIGIIDKLNYTADNNAITTQDLTDALLQASSVAKIAGMSFEDTIGVLTAMKEASGRTGKEVGNAFKSIMSYIQRDSSLKVFDAAGIEVYADKATGELLPMMEILTNMANKWGSVGDEAVDALVKSADEAQLFSEDFAAVLGMEEEYNEMLRMEEEYNKKLRETNDAEARKVTQAAAGVFRRNYFIALMEKFAKTTEISTEALDAEGYSMQENTRYMETYEAKVKQLQTSLQSLAVQAADSGLLDIAKNALDIAIQVSALTEDLGGLSTVLLSLLGIIVMFKQAAIAKELLAIKSSVTSLFTAISTGAMTANAALGAISIALVAVAGIIAAVNYAAKEGERAIEDMATAADNFDDTTNKLNEVKNELEEVNAQIALIQDKGKITLTDEAELERLTKQVDELERSVKYYEILQEKNAKDLAESAEKAYKKNQGKTWGGANDIIQTNINNLVTVGDYGLYSQYRMYLPVKYSETDTTTQIAYLDKLKSKYQEMETELNRIAEAQKNTTNETELEALKNNYFALSEVMDEYGGKIVDVKASISENAIALEDYISVMEKVPEYSNNDTLKDMKIQLDFLKASLYEVGDAADVVEKKKAVSINSLSDYQMAVKNGTISNKAFTESIKEQNDVISATDENISEYISNISMLNGYLQTLNNGGTLTAEQVMKLVELYPELATQVQYTADGFRIESSVLEELNKTNVEAAVAYKISQIDATKAVSEETQKRLVQFGYEMDGLLKVAELEAEISLIRQQTAAMEISVSDEQTGRKIEENREKIASLEQALAELKDAETELGDFWTNIFDSSGTSSSSSSSAEKAVSILDELLADFDKFNGMGILTVSEQIEYLNYVLKDTRLTTEEVGTVQNKLFALYKQQIQEVINKEKEASEARQQAIQDTYNAKIEAAKNASNEEIESIKNAYDAEIDALKEYKSSVSEEREEEDYIEKRNKLLQERAYWEQRTGREAVEKIDDIDERIADLDKSFVRSEEDKAIEEQVSILEKKRDNEIEYRQQLQEITIANLQAQMQMEIQAEKDKYAAFQAQFSEANINMIAAAGVYAPSLYEQFLKHFTEPMANDIISLITLFEQLFNMKASLIGGSSLNGNITVTNGGVVKASSGGYTLGDGMMMLHKNEFIVNPELTTRLDKFLEAFDNTTANYSPNAQYLKNPLTVGVPQRVSNSTNNSEKKVIIEAGAFSATYNVSDKADAKANADEFSREIMNRISKMV